MSILLTPQEVPKSNGTRGRKKAAPVSPVESDKEEFEVEAILESGIDSDTREHMFLVKWKGYGDDENTWEPKKNLAHATDLIKAFEKKPAKPATTGTGKPRGRPKKA